MKVGDLITTYYYGYFRLTRIEKRYVTEELKRYNTYITYNIGDEYSPLYHFVQEYDSKGNVKKSKEKQCDSLFCKLAIEEILKTINEQEDLINKLINIKQHEESKI